MRSRLGLAFFLFAFLVSALAALEHPTPLAWLSALHNLALAWFYARRKPETAYDRTGLWLGLMAAFLPMPFTPDKTAAPFLILVFIQVLRLLREEKVIAGYPGYADQVRWRLVPFIF